MKTRIGFVSNSSTTSFCIYGAELNGRQILSRLRYFVRNNPATIEQIEKSMSEDKYGREQFLIFKEVIDCSEDDINDCEGRNEVIEILERITNLQIYNALYDGGSIYIGDGLMQMDLDETLKQFKERIELEISRIFGKNIVYEFIDETIPS